MAPATSPTPGVAGIGEHTTTAGRARAGGPVLHSRACAVVTAVSCVAHLWWAAAGHHGVWLGIVMVALAAVCVPCTVHIWRHSRVRALHQVTLSALLTVVLHAALLLGAGGAGHAHGGRPASYFAQTSGSAQLLLIIGLELVTALLAASLVARLRKRSFCPRMPG
ncbi:conserved membrane hypothetical protein [Arthrobacter sp. 9AX]|uniref:hypothetical protein n=1 Tax=Arthrobacter sp. 9AX TaxID=2653131 RepID=UPI0012F07046|nr:hypothetical protein [Arthrobacter sp. 9AX]VXC27643.1 conserved membrane hypothetical protein [Arthrobacter sp. 9AX]